MVRTFLNEEYLRENLGEVPKGWEDDALTKKVTSQEGEILNESGRVIGGFTPTMQSPLVQIGDYEED